MNLKLIPKFFSSPVLTTFILGYGSLIMLPGLMLTEKSTLICRYTPATNSSLCLYETQPLLWFSQETTFFQLSEIEATQKIVRGTAVNILVLKTNQGNFSTDYDLDVIEPINNFINEPSEYPYLNLQLNSKSIHFRVILLVIASFLLPVVLLLCLVELHYKSED